VVGVSGRRNMNCVFLYVCGRVGGFKVQGLGFRQVV